MGLVGKVALLESEPPENWSQKTDLIADLEETWRIQGLLQFSSSNDTRRRWCGWGASFILFDSDTIDRFWSNIQNWAPSKDIGRLEFNPCGAKEQDKRPDHAERRALSHAQRFPGSQWSNGTCILTKQMVPIPVSDTGLFLKDHDFNVANGNLDAYLMILNVYSDLWDMGILSPSSSNPGGMLRALPAAKDVPCRKVAAGIFGGRMSGTKLGPSWPNPWQNMLPIEPRSTHKNGVLTPKFSTFTNFIGYLDMYLEGLYMVI